jgi:hypothetical protein
VYLQPALQVGSSTDSLRHVLSTAAIRGVRSGPDCTEGACPAGTFTGVDNVTQTQVCQPCPMGSYSATAGSNVCVKCDASRGETTVAEGSTRCDACFGMFYMDKLGRCRPCMEGVECGLLGSSNVQQLVLERGRWRSGPLSEDVFVCPTPE